MAAGLKLGISGYDFKEYRFEEMLRLFEQLEIHHLELWAYNIENENLPMATVKQLLADHGVSVACVNTSAKYRINRADDVPACQAAIIHHLELAHELNAPYVNLYLGHNTRRDPYSTIRICESLLAPCFQAAEHYGIQLLTENHFDMRNEDPTGEDLVRWPEPILTLLELVGDRRLQLTFDPCNFYLAGVEPFPYAYELLKGVSPYIHLKDAVRYSELLHGSPSQYAMLSDSQVGSFIPVAVGRGAINFSGFLSAVQTDGFDGYLILEPHTMPGALASDTVEGIRYVRSQLG